MFKLDSSGPDRSVSRQRKHPPSEEMRRERSKGRMVLDVAACDGAADKAIGARLAAVSTMQRFWLCRFIDAACAAYQHEHF